MNVVLRRSGKCSALVKGICPNYASCPFYKPVWMAERDVERANRKLCALPMDEQLNIAEKYYNDEMPWRSEI